MRVKAEFPPGLQLSQEPETNLTSSQDDIISPAQLIKLLHHRRACGGFPRRHGPASLSSHGGGLVVSEVPRGGRPGRAGRSLPRRQQLAGLEAAGPTPHAPHQGSEKPDPEA